VADKWECWVRPGRKAKVGDHFEFSQKLFGQLTERNNDIFVFEFNLKNSDFYNEIEKIGQMPIPPYILKARDRKDQPEYEKSDLKNYQTIFAKKAGSVAAPTAGLHFDDDLLSQLNKNGIQTERVTLHVSLGTFQPVTTEKIEDFKIHSEYFEINKKTTENLNLAKKAGKRIIAVGTTSVRVLESAAKDKVLQPSGGETSIYIYPGYKFRFVDGMITNFHLPKSSLLLLVSAFAGKENILNAYNHAIKEQYRFYSYGDGMLIR
jgi:S-adenosylmethionine:tRNA ribosyltransferase-isomerase